MEHNQINSLLNWAYYSQEKSMEELKHSLLYTSLELEETRLTAQIELSKRDYELTNLKNLIKKMMRERDVAVEKWQRLLYQQQEGVVLSGISWIEDEPRRLIHSENGFSSLDCEEIIVSSSIIDQTTVETVGLPERGKLLQAVMEAGPLLKTLLHAGQLPRWKHPPPPLESVDIPPVTILSRPPSPLQPPQLLHRDSLININGGCNMKRVLVCDDSPAETKHQRRNYWVPSIAL